MKVSQAKENILKKIRQALTHSTPLPFPQSEGNNTVFQTSQQELEIEFAEKFTNLLGKFIFCLTYKELASQLNNLVNHTGWKNIYCCEETLKSILQKNNFSNFSGENLGECDAAITSCELLIARTGSIVMSTGQASGRTVSVYAPIHICIAHTNQLVYDIKDGLQLLKEKFPDNLPSLITFATGQAALQILKKLWLLVFTGQKKCMFFWLMKNKK